MLPKQLPEPHGFIFLITDARIPGGCKLQGKSFCCVLIDRLLLQCIFQSLTDTANLSFILHWNLRHTDLLRCCDQAVEQPQHGSLGVSGRTAIAQSAQDFLCLCPLGGSDLGGTLLVGAVILLH